MTGTRIDEIVQTHIDCAKQNIQEGCFIPCVYSLRDLPDEGSVEVQLEDCQTFFTGDHSQEAIERASLQVIKSLKEKYKVEQGIIIIHPCCSMEKVGRTMRELEQGLKAAQQTRVPMPLIDDFLQQALMVMIAEDDLATFYLLRYDLVNGLVEFQPGTIISTALC